MGLASHKIRNEFSTFAKNWSKLNGDEQIIMDFGSNSIKSSDFLVSLTASFSKLRWSWTTNLGTTNIYVF